MKRFFQSVLCAALCLGTLTGCSGSSSKSGGASYLVTREPFPQFSEKDMNGAAVSSDMFADYDATIINFWNNGCGTCIAEMPELEEMYQSYKEKNINLIGIGTDSGESERNHAEALDILASKGVTYTNISPDPESDFYKGFIKDIFTYPTTYVIDSEGYIIGAPITGNVKNQMDALEKKLDQAQASKESD